MLSIEEIKQTMAELNLDEETRARIEEILTDAELEGELTQEDREEIANMLRAEAQVSRERAEIWDEARKKLLEVEEEWQNGGQDA